MLAYFDSITGGFIPCRVLAVGKDAPSAYVGYWVRIQFTVSRGPWRRGEMTTWTMRHVVPRHSVHRSRQSPGRLVVWAHDMLAECRKAGVEGAEQCHIDATYRAAENRKQLDTLYR